MSKQKKITEKNNSKKKQQRQQLCTISNTYLTSNKTTETANMYNQQHIVNN